MQRTAIEIVRAMPEMAPVLSDLAFASKQHWGYPDDWMNEWRSSLTITPDAICAHLTYAALESQQPIGFYLLQLKPSEAILEHLWVTPPRIGKGIGRLLFEHAVAEARQHNCRSILIESDPHAEGFYALMGARKISTNVSCVLGVQRELRVMRYVVLGQ